MNLIFGAFALSAVATVLELIAYVRWNKFYFSTGIRILRVVADVEKPPTELPDPGDLQRRFEDSKLLPILFQRIGQDLMSFREATWGHFDRARYTPIMRGVLSFDRERSQVVVQGRLMYFHIAFLAIFFGGTYAMGLPWLNLLAVHFTVAFYAVLFAIQRRRFRRVADLAAAAWSSLDFEHS